ncbi:hypothetical protein GOARA_056_02100 [Gordonia araii NBRC 100433]|uniref:Transmembrane protein n=1 Tax=Gordonia araii NBRC 100433 TaxID=1073574 RepID=G7H3N7_9ACTN|nr:gephyrin-like molybdotransferase receptor GlpR [Gordonia araii]GAB10462.1 hypothetical protein GOARA_056_02100 [Gordonia araii NBRC 100433]
MPNSVLWVCLVAIWLFVLVPMVIQGRPGIRKSTPVAAATRVLKRGEDAVRRRRIGAGAHPHDPDYTPKTETADKVEAVATSKESTPTKVEKALDEDLAEATAEPVDPSRVPGKVPTRQRATARTVAARMRRVVTVTTTRPAPEDADTEVIKAVGAADSEDIIDAEIVEDTVEGSGKDSDTDVVEVQTVEALDVEITERIEKVVAADESPTERIEKVVEEKEAGEKPAAKRDTTDVAAKKADEEPAATLFDVDEEPVKDESADKPDADENVDVVAAEAEVPEADRGDEVAEEKPADDVASEGDDDEVAAESDDTVEADLDEADDDLIVDEFDDEDEVAELDDADGEANASWDDIDPNELTQVMMTRPGRGGYDPEVDRERIELKYKERQRVLLTLVGLTLAGIVAGVFLSTPGWIAAGVLGTFLVAYLVFLRRAVKNESQIRQRRLARLERSRREEVARRRRDRVEPEFVADEPAPRPRLRRPSGMAPVAIDDEDPIFDHLPTYQQPRMMRADDDFRAAVG